MIQEPQIAVDSNRIGEKTVFRAFEYAYVINLDEDRERMEKISSRLDRLGVPFDRFPAVGVSRNTRFSGRHVLPEAYACAETHAALLRLILQREHENVLILEDDGVFRDDTADLMEKIASDLISQPWDIFYMASPDRDGQMHAGWLATDSGILYTSNRDIGASGVSDNGGGIHKYWIDQTALRSGGGYVLYYMEEQKLYERDGSTPANLQIVQGGALSSDGHLIYLSNGCCGDHSGNGWGIRVFDKSTGVLQARSQNNENNYGPFNYQFDAGFPNYQEPEGLDYFDSTGKCIPGLNGKCLSNSQLHVLLYSNRSGAIWLKHYSE